MYRMEAMRRGMIKPVVREFPTLTEAKKAGERCHGGGMEVIVIGPRGLVARLVKKLKPSGKRNVEGNLSGKYRWTR